MGLLSRLLGGGSDEASVQAAMAAAVEALPGVSAQALRYNHQPQAAGAVSGTVDVADSATFLDVLRVVRRALGDALGDRADRVTFYLTGRTPDGDAVAPGDLGLAQPPTGHEVRQRLG